jgi:two-component system, cell cycle sensor histidine kinase and response regulator CckA
MHRSHELSRDPSVGGDDYRRIIDSLGAVLWEADGATFQFTYVSQSAVDILGYSVDEWLAPGFWRAHTHADDVEWATAFCLDSSAHGRDHQFEYRMTAADGRVVWIHDVVMVKVGADGSRALSGIMIDITERKRTAERLREVEAQLREAQKMEAVGRLAGGVAHDFNNLLTVITGYADLAMASGGSRDPRGRDIEEIRRAADRAAVLTQQLLAFSRKQVMHPRVIDVNVELRDLSTMLSRLIGEDVAFELDLDARAGAVLLDPGQLQQILMNLAVNARDAMPHGGRLTVATSEWVGDREEPALPAPLVPGRYVRVVVSDTGTGMPPDVVSRCFEPFFTTKDAGKGTGLGLSTVYGVITQSLGYIRVESAPGQGTRFEIFFRRVGSPPNAVGAVAESSPRLGDETILMVEDNDLVRRVAERTLTEAGYRVLSATSAANAIQIAVDYPGSIDLVLTDVIMPGMPGPLLIQRLEAMRPGIRVLYMSGYTGDIMARHGVDEERVSFLPKPFSADQLARRTREILDTK